MTEKKSKRTYHPLLPVSCTEEFATQVRRFCRRTGIPFSSKTRELWDDFIVEYERKRKEESN